MSEETTGSPVKHISQDDLWAGFLDKLREKEWNCTPDEIEFITRDELMNLFGYKLSEAIRLRTVANSLGLDRFGLPS
jgi:hypothetical protein